MLKREISVRCLSVHLGITYVPATVAGAFWLDWLCWANEVLSGMARPLKARCARVMNTEAPKARILTQVSGINEPGNSHTQMGQEYKKRG